MPGVIVRHVRLPALFVPRGLCDIRRASIIQELEPPLRLTPPSFAIFLVSVICGVIALLRVFGIVAVAVPVSNFWLMTLAWGLMTIGVLFRRA